MKRLPQRWWLIAAVLAASGLLGAGAWAWRAAQERAAVLAVLPAQPDLAGRPSALALRLEQAEQRARSLRHRASGLAELARLYHANGFLPEATACIEALMQLQPADPLWPYLRAHTLGGYGELERALPLIERTVELAPDYLPARIRLANAWLKRNQTARAAALYQHVLQADPDHGYAVIGLARTELADGQPEAARQRLQRLVDAQPQFAPAWPLLISIDEQLGDQAAANLHHRQARSTGRPREMPDPWIDDLMADCFDAYRLCVAASTADPANNQARARQLLERAIAVAPDDDLPCRLLGNLLSDLGESAAARTYLERATVNDPADPDNWSHLVRVLQATGDRAAADRALRTGLAHCPEAPSLHLERGRQLVAAGQLDAAAAAFQLTRRLRPDDSRPSMELARVLFKLNRLEEGVEELRRVVQLEPNHPVAVVLLGRYAIDQGDAAAASEWISRARAQPEVPAADLQRVLAEYHARFGRLP